MLYGASAACFERGMSCLLHRKSLVCLCARMWDSQTRLCSSDSFQGSTALRCMEVGKPTFSVSVCCAYTSLYACCTGGGQFVPWGVLAPSSVFHWSTNPLPARPAWQQGESSSMQAACSSECKQNNTMCCTAAVFERVHTHTCCITFFSCSTSNSEFSFHLLDQKQHIINGHFTDYQGSPFNTTLLCLHFQLCCCCAGLHDQGPTKQTPKSILQ